MRLRTSGKYAYREDLYERTADTLSVESKTAAIENACIHVNQDMDAKQQALEYLSSRLSPDELREVAEILSTDQIELDVEIETTVSTD